MPSFGSFMTGVTVVTACGPDGRPVGFTANSFSSVSLTPPMLLVCPGRFLSSFEVFANCTHFAVNVLAEGQEDVSNTFASFKGDRFAQVAHRTDLHGVPLIEGAIAQFSCATDQSVPTGDHCVLIGRVLDMRHEDKPGLGYVSGQYFSLGLERAALEDGPGTVICEAIIETGGTVLLEKTQDGFRLPQVTRSERAHLRQSLSKDLAARGIAAHLGQVYSVFDDRRSATHHAYILATCAQPVLAGNLQAVSVQGLFALTYTTPTIAQMMRRFALEAGTRSFGLYLGDTQHGDVHTLPERN